MAARDVRMITATVRVFHQLHFAREGKLEFVDIEMPNGKKLTDCSMDEIEQMAEKLADVVRKVEKLEDEAETAAAKPAPRRKKVTVPAKRKRLKGPNRKPPRKKKTKAKRLKSRVEVM